MTHKGTLIVKPLSAQLTHDTDTFGKMDPFVKVTAGSQTFTSGVAKSMGKTPSWHDVFQINIVGEHSINLAIYDKDKFSKDEFIGDCTIQLQDVFLRRSMADQYEIFYDGKLGGKIMVQLEFNPQP